MKKINIAIDGHSSTGKSTTARRLADHLDYLYVDSGAMYRAITLYALQNQLIDQSAGLDQHGLITALPDIHLSFKRDKDGANRLFLNQHDVSEEIRLMAVSDWVSPIATISEVRSKLVAIQREIGKEKGVVMDGRDIGTVVFPDAELKIFMTATATERARRRYSELKERGEKVSYQEVLDNVTRRDEIDSSREQSPLRKAPDAIVVDNTEMAPDDQLHIILQLAKDRIAGRA